MHSLGDGELSAVSFWKQEQESLACAGKIDWSASPGNLLNLTNWLLWDINDCL